MWILQVLLLHEIFSDDLPGISIDAILPAYTRMVCNTSQMFSSWAQFP
jgi:hypothetical protein